MLYARFFTICTHVHQLCINEILFPLTYTNNFSILYHIYIASLIKIYPTWRWPQQRWPKHVVDVDKLYIPDNLFVLWLHPYGIITLDITAYVLIMYQSSIMKDAYQALEIKVGEICTKCNARRLWSSGLLYRLYLISLQSRNCTGVLISP